MGLNKIHVAIVLLSRPELGQLRNRTLKPYFGEQHDSGGLMNEAVNLCESKPAPLSLVR